MLHVLRLERAADTVVGNEFIRGVSGGEKRRLTVGEMLVSAPQNLHLGREGDRMVFACTADGQPPTYLP